MPFLGRKCAIFTESNEVHKIIQKEGKRNRWREGAEEVTTEGAVSVKKETKSQ